MKNFQAEIAWLDPEKLTPYANNAKEHTTEQVDKIARQIHKFGFDQPIVVDSNHVIVKGHGRREASLRLGLKKVPVIVRTDLSEYELMAARLGDNEVAKADYNKDFLKFELGTLQHNEIDLADAGFDLKDAEKILREAEESDETFEVDDDIETEADTQFIVAVTCVDESQMKQIFDEMVSRGLSCTLIT